MSAEVASDVECAFQERDLVARWLLEAEVELQEAQQAARARRPCAKARLAQARLDHDLAVKAATRLMAFPKLSWR